VDLRRAVRDDTPRDLIVACRPDVLVKGGDYTAEDDRRSCETIGARALASPFPLLPGRSTTRLVERIRGGAMSRVARVAPTA